MGIKVKIDNDKIYTPINIVNKILDDIGYNGYHILGKKIIDHSCGDGRFLIEIAKRIIVISTPENLTSNLEKIYGIDIDEDAIYKCINNLNNLLPLFITVNWNIRVGNALEDITNMYGSFDYVVGNPPYIRIHNLDEYTKTLLRTKYEFCKFGSTDIYLGFFELSKNLIHDNGIIGLITPNSFIYTGTGKVFRKYLIDNKSLVSLSNFGTFKIFSNVNTYTAITIFNKKINESFQYFDHSDIKTYNQIIIQTDVLNNIEIWNLKDTKINTGSTLKDVCSIHVGMETLANDIFVIEPHSVDDKFVYVNSKIRIDGNIIGEIQIEKDILKPVIKISKYKNNDPIKNYIIFPYVKVNGKYQPISENDFLEKYPKTYHYLSTVRSEHLDTRDKGKPKKYKWYAFGREQGLNTAFGEKIIFSNINKEPNFIHCPAEDTTVYSGYFIKTDKIKYDELLKILNSNEMKTYIDQVSGDYSSGWKSYTKKLVENFPL